MLKKVTLNLFLVTILLGCDASYKYSRKENDATLIFLAYDLPKSYFIKLPTDKEFKKVGPVFTPSYTKTTSEAISAAVNSVLLPDRLEIAVPSGVLVDIRSEHKTESKYVRSYCVGYRAFTSEPNAHYQVTSRLIFDESNKAICALTLENVTNPAAPVIVPNEVIASPAVR